MLTNKQIDALFAFCKKHYVSYYDIQVELVDHLANAIEEKMNVDPNLSFEAALDNIYAGFGKMGFSQLVKTRAHTLERKYQKQRVRFFFSYFTWPKIGLTALVIAILLYTGSFFSGETLYYITMVTAILWFLYDLFVHTQIWRLMRKQSVKMAMTEIVIQEPFALFFFSCIVFPNAIYDEVSYSGFMEFILTTGSIILLTLVLMAYKHVSNKVYEEARRQYPRAFEEK